MSTDSKRARDIIDLESDEQKPEKRPKIANVQAEQTSVPPPDPAQPPPIIYAELAPDSCANLRAAICTLRTRINTFDEKISSLTAEHSRSVGTHRRREISDKIMTLHDRQAVDVEMEERLLRVARDIVPATVRNGPQLFVKTLTGKTLTIGCSLDATVWDFKFLVFMKEGIPVYQQRLIFAGKSLDTNEEATLRSYGIKRETTLHLVLRVRGC